MFGISRLLLTVLKHIVGQPFIIVEHFNTVTYTTVCLKGERVPRAFLTTQIKLHLTL